MFKNRPTLRVCLLFAANNFVRWVKYRSAYRRHYGGHQYFDMVNNQKPVAPADATRQSRYGSSEINKALRKDLGGTPKGPRAAHMSISLGNRLSCPTCASRKLSELL